MLLMFQSMFENWSSRLSNAIQAVLFVLFMRNAQPAKLILTFCNRKNVLVFAIPIIIGIWSEGNVSCHALKGHTQK